MPDRHQRHVFAVLVAALLWGTTGTVAHHAPAGTEQAVVGLSTFGFGGLVMFAFSGRRIVTMLRDPTARWLMVVGALGVATYAALYYWSMAVVGVAIGNAIALGSGPVFAALLELTIERRRPSGGWLAATLVSIAGITCLAAAAGGSHGGGAGSTTLGVGLGLAAGFGYALYSWSAARLITLGHPSLASMSAVFAVAAIGLVPAFFVLDPGPLYSPKGVAILAYLALIPMAGAYVLFGYGLRSLTASAATTLALGEPVVATLLAVSILHERLTLLGWTGLSLIIAGICVLAWAERRARPDPEPAIPLV